MKYLDKHRVHKTKTTKAKLQLNICWTPLYTKKQNYVIKRQLVEKMNRTSHYAEIVMDITTRNSERKDT